MTNQLQSIDARTGQPVGEAWQGDSPAAIDHIVAAAVQAAPQWAQASVMHRGVLLRALADALEADRQELVALADRETALGETRLNGELDRTAFQLRGFADALARGMAHAVVDDPAVAGAPPAGRPALLKVQVPLGPVAVFAASNFPFAFSVLGGDTASALAAGCPVVVKAHPAHPALSRRMAALGHAAVADAAAPAGVFGMIEGSAVQAGVHLVRCTGIAAVAFTGSLRGGMALARVAAERPHPIPFYGELGSINPVILLPDVAQAEAIALATALANSIGAGSGQFCTSPGLVVVPTGALGDAFVQALADAIRKLSLHPMLTPSMRAAFECGVAAWRAHAGLERLVDEPEAAAQAAPRPFLAQTRAAVFIADAALHEEVFGSAALVVRTASVDEIEDVLAAIGGTLTTTVWGAAAGTPAQRRIVQAAMRVSGRVLFDGVPTGVAVTAAQQHGGPFPASTQAQTTSVGYDALLRFLRPVALQDAPDWARQTAAGLPA